MADAQLRHFLEQLNQNKGDARNFISDKIATELQQRGVLDDADVLEIFRSDFTAKTSKLIGRLVQKHQSGHQNVVQEFRSVLEKSRTQKHLAKLLPLPRAPVVTVQNSSLVMYCKRGGTVDISIQADGDGPLRYQWLSGDAVLKDEDKNVVKIGAGGEYVCRISSDVGETQSEPVNVVIVQELADSSVKPEDLQDFYERNNLIIHAPPEIAARGLAARKAYYDALSNGAAMKSKRVRLMVVGRDGAGKTSLVNALLNRFDPLVSNVTLDSTEGVEFTLVKCHVADDGDLAKCDFEEVENVEAFLHREKARIIAHRLHEKERAKRFQKQETEASVRTFFSPADTKSEKREADVTVKEDEEDYSFPRDDFITSEHELDPPELKDYVAEELRRLRHSYKDSSDCESEHLVFIISDFAGQPVYLNSHAAFLAPSGVYILVHDLHETLELNREAMMCTEGRMTKVEESSSRTNEEYIRTWVTSIGATRPTPQIAADVKLSNPAVLVVGTRLDIVLDAKRRWSNLASFLTEREKSIRQYLNVECPLYSHYVSDDFFFVDNTGTLRTARRELLELRRAIVEKALLQESTTCLLPLTWIELELEILSLRQKGKYCVEARSLCSQVKLDEAQATSALQYFHDNGTIVFFYEEEREYRQYVVTDPDWLVRVFRSVVSAHSVLEDRVSVSKKMQRLREAGIFSYQDIKAKLPDGEDSSVMLDILQRYDFLSPYLLQSKERDKRLDASSSYESEYFLAPSIVTRDPPIQCFFSHPELFPDKAFPSTHTSSQAEKPLYFSCKCKSVPESLYTRLVTRLASRYCVCPEIFRNFARLHYDSNYDIIIANWSNLEIKDDEKKKKKKKEKQKGVRARIFVTVVDAAKQRSSPIVCQEVYRFVTSSLYSIREVGMKGLNFAVEYRKETSKVAFEFQFLSEKQCVIHSTPSCCHYKCLESLLEGSGVSEEAKAIYQCWIPPTIESRPLTLPVCKGSRPKHGTEILSIDAADTTLTASGRFHSVEWRIRGIVSPEDRSHSTPVNFFPDGWSLLYTYCHIDDSLNYRFSLPYCSYRRKKKLDVKLQISVYQGQLRPGTTHSFQYGESVSLRCDASGSQALPSLRYQWYFEELKIPNANKESYKIATLRDYRAGKYFCTVSLDSEFSEERSEVVCLNVQGQEKQKVGFPVVSPAINSSAQAFTDKVALLIGNQTYETLDDLTTPENDVRSVAKYLKNFGFHVMVCVDLGFFDMVDAFEKFYLLAQPGTFAVVFFGGHGFEANGDQYMTPVDWTRSPTSRKEIGAQSVLQVLESASVTFKILDCCRKQLPLKVPSIPQKGANSCNSIVLTTCSTRSCAYEDSNHSFFCGAFVEALKTLCQEQDRPAPISRLFDLTRKNLSAQKKQTPELRMSLGAYGSSVSFTDPCFENSDARKKNDDRLKIWHAKKSVIDEDLEPCNNPNPNPNPNRHVRVRLETSRFCMNVLDVKLNCRCIGHGDKFEILEIVAEAKDLQVGMEFKKRLGFGYRLYGLQHLRRASRITLDVEVRYWLNGVEETSSFSKAILGSYFAQESSV